MEFKEEKIMLYNTIDGNRIEITSKDVMGFVSQLYEPNNWGVTLFSEEMQSYAVLSDFVRETKHLTNRFD